jgi:tetratricopeptide (TPR) repeat protein
VIQIGAVIGNEFSYELLHVVHPIAEQGLQEALRTATDAELVYVRGIAPDATYQFKHALVRDAAYEALLKTRRRDLHRMVAQTITDKFTGLAKAHPEVLARHWTEARETQQAIVAWSSAGKSAESRNAFKEALGSYQQALTLLEALPESAERNDRELELSQSVVSMLYVTKGYTAPETVEATEWAAELAQKSGNLTQLVDVMVSRGFTAYFSGDSTTAGALADGGLELALRDGRPTNLGRLYTLLILTRYWRGDLVGVDRHFTIGLKFFDDPDFRQIGLGAAAAFAHASWNAWMLGRTDVAREPIVRMIAYASEKNPYQVAFSGYFSAVLSVYLREYNCARASAARALELSEKHQYPYVAASSRCVLGHALAQLDNAREGIGLIRQGIAGLLEIGSRAGISRTTTYLAAAQECNGAIADALETVEQAVRVNPDELAYRPESFRLLGELRLKLGHLEQAEASFREAIALASSMGAKGWELRTTMSLVRLLAKQGRGDDARAMLADIYNWFTEGFDTADLQDAKSMLDKLTTESK